VWTRATSPALFVSSGVPTQEGDTKVKRLVVLAVLFAAVLALGVPAIAQPDAKEVYPGPIDIDKMDAARRAVNPYSFYVPPYNLYYFHHIDKLNIQQDWIRRSGPVFALREPSAPFSASYTYANQKHSLDEYFDRNYVVGFLVLHDNQILLEKYFHGADQESRFLSNSVSKSFTSVLIGAAIAEGKIKSVDDPVVKYLPWLKESKIKFIFDEWGNRPRSANGQNQALPGMLGPLSYALCLHEMFRHSDKITASCATGGLRLLTDITGDAVGFAAEGVVMKLMQTQFLNAVPIGVDGDSPQRQVRGTDYVDKGPTPTGSPTYPLDVLAAFSGDRKRFLMSVVNPTEDEHSFTPRIRALRLRERGKLYQIAPPGANSANEAGKEAVVKIDETEQAGMPETIRVPPVSISLYEFEVETT